jgi:hypothetical protein
MIPEGNLDNFDEEFVRYIDEGVEMTRDLTYDEGLWVYLNLK